MSRNIALKVSFGWVVGDSGNKTTLSPMTISGFSAACLTYAVQSLATKKIIAIFVATKHVVRTEF